ncbi:MAG TPA: hypothetical protein VGB85_25410, partial [Nannocystis sp.]
MHDEPRNELEQRALAAWTPAEPPADFVDRVMRAAATDSRADRVADVLDGVPLPRLRWPRFVAAAIAAVALAGGVTAGIKYWPAPVASAPTESRDSIDDGVPVSLTPPAAQAPKDDVPADLDQQIDRYMA